MTSSSLPVVLVFGGTGSVGAPLVAALSTSTRPFRIRVLTRDAGGAEAKRLAQLPRVEMRTADPHQCSNSDALAALQDVRRLMFIYAVPFNPSNAATTARWLKLAGGQLEFVVYLSAMACVGPIMPPYGVVHGQVQRAIADSGVPSCVLGPNAFMQNFITAAKKPMMGVNDGRIVGMAGEAPMALCDTRDIGECAATVLTAPREELSRYAGKQYEITGGAPMRSFAEVAQLLSTHFHRRVVYDDMTPEQYKAWLMRHLRFPEFVADLFVDGMNWVRTGQGSHIGSGVRDILGREPRTWSDFLADFGAQFRFEEDQSETAEATKTYGQVHSGQAN